MALSRNELYFWLSPANYLLTDTGVKHLHALIKSEAKL